MVGGIHIPDNAGDGDWKSALVGEVVGVGDGYRESRDGSGWTALPERVPLDVKVGDRVLYPKNVAEEITLVDAKLHLMHEEVVLAIVDDDIDIDTKPFERQ